MKTLERELATYSVELPTLLSQAGKHVVIKGDEIVGVFDSYEDALKAGFAKFQLDPFLVKRITPAENVQFFTRGFQAQCPA